MRFLLVIIVGLGVASISSCVRAQNNDRSIDMLNSFYSAYLAEVAGSDPIDIMNIKLDSLRKRFCTQKLLHAFPDIMEETDADAFIKAQDANLSSLKTLRIRKDSKNVNGYVVSYATSYSKDTTTIYLTVVKEKEEYRIDSIR